MARPALPAWTGLHLGPPGTALCEPGKGGQSPLCCQSAALAKLSFSPAGLLMAAHVEAAARSCEDIPRCHHTARPCSSSPYVAHRP